jgi:hypothetical protein
MRINFLFKGVLVAATLCVAPAALPASPRASRAGVGSAQSSKGAFANSASNLLQQIQTEALRVKSDASQLQAYTREPFESDWQMDGDVLNRASVHVNAMGRLLHQLRVNQGAALPWQQQAIERIAPTVVNLADTTQDAIVTLNNSRGRIQFSNLEGLADDMYKDASLIGQVIANFEKYASARQEAQQLQQTLGL